MENNFVVEATKKKQVFDRLRENGFRITKQREVILDIILQNNCTCCKEIYMRAAKKDPDIGLATVYRMLNTLEEAEIISRKRMYQLVIPESVAE